jgi:hypothetical protein
MEYAEGHARSALGREALARPRHSAHRRDRHGPAGVPPHIIEAVLNHVSGHKAGVAGVYNRARYADEMRIALERWAEHVEAVTS